MIDVHALVGAYAVDAVDDLERAAFERHLAECPACQSELASLREAAATLPLMEPLEPPARMREHVLAGIGGIRPLPPEVAPREEPEAAPSRRRFRPSALVAAAAAVIALGAGAGLVVQQPWDDSSQVQPTAAERIRAADDAQTFTAKVDGATATVTLSKSMNQAVLDTRDMPDAPSGSVYELWLVHDERMVPAGLMANGDHEVILEGDPATATGFGITVEPDGGSEEPNLDAVVTQMDFEQA